MQDLLCMGERLLPAIRLAVTVMITRLIYSWGQYSIPKQTHLCALQDVQNNLIQLSRGSFAASV